MNDELFSIIINNYNYGQFLREAIESALSQTYPNLEVVVVDDGSTDQSRSTIEGYGNRIIPVLKANGGQGSAINAGFAASRGEYILFLDSDDFLHPGAVQRIMHKFRSDVSLGKVHFRLEMVDNTGRSLGRTVPNAYTPLPEGDLSETVHKYGPGSYTNPPTTGNAFRRKSLDMVLPIPEKDYRISADSYLFMTIPFTGTMGSLDGTFGSYRVHQNNGYWQTSLNLDKLHRQVELYLVRVRDLREFLQRIGVKGTPITWTSPFPLATRMTTLKLDRMHHRVTDDTLFRLMVDGLSTTWAGPIRGSWHRVILSCYFFAMVLLPKTLCARLAQWLFVPESRPNILKVVLR